MQDECRADGPRAVPPLLPVATFLQPTKETHPALFHYLRLRRLRAQTEIAIESMRNTLDFLKEQEADAEESASYELMVGPAVLDGRKYEHDMDAHGCCIVTTSPLSSIHMHAE